MAWLFRFSIRSPASPRRGTSYYSIVYTARGNTLYSDISLDVVADNLCRATSRARQIDILKMDPVTSSTRTTRKIRHHLAVLPTARPRDVQEPDICDFDFGRVRCTSRLVDVEVALVKDDRCIRVLDVNVLVSNVVDITVANIRSSPSFETSTVLTIQQGNVLDPSVRDVVLDARILSNRAHRHAVSAVAP